MPSRGEPGELDARIARALQLRKEGPAGAAAPLLMMAAVLRYQAANTDQEAAARLTAGAAERLTAGRFPLLELDAVVGPTAVALPAAVGALAGETPGSTPMPEPLGDAGRALASAPPPALTGLIETWLEDPANPDPAAAFWLSVTAGGLLEAARAQITTPSRDDWSGAACPACGGLPQVSVIAPETGEFMGGSPRSLVCGRCAGWWTFARATCTWCLEDDPRRLAPYVPEAPAQPSLSPARIDACETCRAYIKTFDLRSEGGVAVVPLVDDVATVALDLWAREQGLVRPLVSLAGV